MKNFSVSLIIVIIVFSQLINSQTVSDFSLENWKTNSSLLNIITADVDSKGRIWAGAAGGVFCYDESTGEFKEFRNIDALISLDITKIAANNSTGEIYIGTYDGYIDIVTEDFKWTHITEIQQPKYPNPKINDIIFNNDLAYIGAGFGLTVFDTKAKVFRQTPPRLGNFQPNTQVNKILIKNNVLWAATDDGVASIDLSKSIIIPDFWQNYTDKNGLPNGPIKGISSFGDSIYCFKGNKVYSLQGDTFRLTLSIDDYNVINTFQEINNVPCISSQFFVFNLSGVALYDKSNMPESSYFNGYFINKKTNDLVFMLRNNALYRQSNNAKHIKPETPVTNLFNDLTLDANGDLWSATDIKGQGMGFMKFSNDIWENFNTHTYSQIQFNDYYKACSMPDGRLIFSSYGSGSLIVEKKDGSYKFSPINTLNSPLTGSSIGDTFCVTGESAYDSRTGLLWITNFAKYFAGPLLVAMDKSGNYTPVLYRTERSYVPLAIDNNGTKWIGSTEGHGLLWFNESGNLKDPNSHKSGNFNSSNSQLPDGNITSIVVDKLGVIWVGTTTGLAYILSPQAVLRNANPIIKPTTIRLLTSQPINDIMVDALNNKWIATNQGVWVLDPDGTTEIAQITTKNSPIVSDEIQSLATKESTGQIFIGTRKGMSEAVSFSIKPLESYNIKCYPQPYNPYKEDALIIEGLAANSDIRILTIDGKLVKAITTTSQKIIWNGRNELGDIVNSGVYMITGTSLTSDATGTAKFVVISK